MMPLIPVIRQPKSVIGALAKTDYSKIYICTAVNANEYNVLFKHEQAHILCEHNRRYMRGMDKRLWNAACDVEIARNIYDDADLAIIKIPYSLLHGGIVPDTFKDMPDDLLYAEDIYVWLDKNKPEDKDVSANDIIESLGSGDGSEKATKDAATLVKNAKREIDGALASMIADNKSVLLLNEIKNRRPLLVDKLDAALRYRCVREASYRRPSRRCIDTTYMIKGKVTMQRPPLVEIFVDRSGSFTPDKTAAAQEKLEILLRKYNTSIKHDVWFFGNGKVSSEDFVGGDTPYHLVYEHINATNPKIAIIITDDDPVSDAVKVIKHSRVLCVPIGCNNTNVAGAMHGIDVIL